ncbi:HalOD1 output domain-containing protein [Haladaptatus salinisoli]|uniref:HalOD1 output domain-containing protein n=1 Tax=Haladaptatus salinisoli TaxID=2884876 RepID=UPI001D0BC501|nr:HalOD1 output domain-containing protein [Haladaptatus salinisoli]
MPYSTDLSKNNRPESLTNHSLSTSVLIAIPDAEGRSVDDLKPLYDAIDPEAFDKLFAPRADKKSRPHGVVSFRYLGYWVTVSIDGTVELE